MVFDLRYHLASLVSVFLALGLGILIGTSISSDGGVLREQSALIDAIEGHLEQLRYERQNMQADLSQATAELALYEEFATRIMPQLVAGRLRGVTIALVGAREDTSMVEELVKLAEGKVVAKAVIKEGLSVSWDVTPSSWPDRLVLFGEGATPELRQALLETAVFAGKPSAVITVEALDTPLRQWEFIEHLAVAS